MTNDEKLSVVRSPVSSFGFRHSSFGFENCSLFNQKVRQRTGESGRGWVGSRAPFQHLPQRRMTSSVFSTLTSGGYGGLFYCIVLHSSADGASQVVAISVHVPFDAAT